MLVSLRQFVQPRAIALPLRTPEWHAITRLCHPASRFTCPANAPTSITYPPSNSSAVYKPPRRAYSTWEEDYPLTLVSEQGAMATTTSAPSTTSSGKRKRSAPAFYAVKKGRVPGIYQSWDDANRNVQGFDNPIYRKFDTQAQAEAFMQGTIKPGKTKYYGVAVGNIPGVYTDWSAVQAQTKGFKGAKHKSFPTREEAQEFVDAVKRGSSAPISLRGDLSETSSLVTSKTENTGDPAPKRQKKENPPPTSALTNADVKLEPGYAPLPPDAVDGFDPTIKMDPDTGNIRAKTDEESSATKLQPTGDFSGPIVVHTDGSALGNGKLGAVGGVGVYFGPNDERNVAEPLRGDRQTNQRAELVAIARALDHIPIDRSAKIITDSNYSIKCLTEWFQKWEDKGWKNAAGKPVENKDLIEPILARIRERDMCRATTKFEWVKGHNNDPGNVAADIAAVEGSRKSTPELRAGQHRDISVTLRTPTRSHQALQNHFRPKVEPALEDMDDGGFDEIFADLAAEQDANAASNAELLNMEEAKGMDENLAGDAVGNARELIDTIDTKVV